jgi:hypothetical protein
MTRGEGDARRRVVRDFYAARHRRDWTAVANCLPRMASGARPTATRTTPATITAARPSSNSSRSSSRSPAGHFTLEPRELISR